MPVYLLHGFRWPRPLIRIHIILQNLDDAAAEWLCQPQTTRVMLENFHQLYPDCMPNLPNLRFIEQYDPEDLSAESATQPYAYVADVVEEIKLGAEIDEIRGKGMASEQWESIMDLRDKVAPDEKVAWWVVVCGDEERWAPPVDSESEYEVEDADEGVGTNARQDSSGSGSAEYNLPIRGANQQSTPALPVQPQTKPSPSPAPVRSSAPAVQPPAIPSKASPEAPQREEGARGFRKFFSSSGRSKTPKKRKRYVEPFAI